MGEPRCGGQLQRDSKQIRRLLCARTRDLEKTDVLLRRTASAPADAAESREAFNKYISSRLLRLAERACVRGDDHTQFREEVLAIIQHMYENKLVSQAFSQCLAKHCRTKMGGFDSVAWRKRAEMGMAKAFKRQPDDMDLS